MKNFTKKSGFTLVEIMVAVSIFAVVAVIATGALVTASDINRKAQAIKLAVDNVNFALNKMAFEMRLGGIYKCGDAGNITAPSATGYGTNCSGGNAISFFTYREDCIPLRSNDIAYCATSLSKIPVTYKLVTTGGKGEIQYSINSDNPSYFAITAPEVNITNLNFAVSNSEEGDIPPPRVKIVVSGVVAEGTKYETTFHLQTAAVSRGN